MSGLHLLAVESKTVYYTVLVASFCAAIGYFIGERKGRSGLGTVLGFLLGLAGLVIVALLPRKRNGPHPG
ncbi:MAG TPA: hypothetical protein VGO78_20455 [Acidimicrobiales bacterium]|jgi:hypothetical protein|nr:hypothetical protein [Acidimicrobiales bacterium]